MDIVEFRETLENTPDSELIRYIRKYVCSSLADASNPTANSHVMLDLVYVECRRRGIENLYDISYENVCRHPKVCKLLHAA